jgi:hypothetical protein
MFQTPKRYVLRRRRRTRTTRCKILCSKQYTHGTSHCSWFVRLAQKTNLPDRHKKWLEETAAQSDLLCIVIFRGSWCKYEKHYLQKLGQHHKTVASQKEKVQLIAWTSEGEAGAAKADEEWGLTKDYGYDAVLGDETNALALWLKEDEILPNLLIVTPDEAQVSNLLPTAAGGSYPNGLVQPGMVWYAHHGSPVFEWVHDGSPPGAGRPDPVALWECVLKRKHALDVGNAVMPSHGVKLCATEQDVE